MIRRVDYLIMGWHCLGWQNGRLLLPAAYVTDPAKHNQQLKARDSLGHGARQLMERLFEADPKMPDPTTKRKS